MSHYLHHIIETKSDDGTWKKFKTVVKPGSYFDDDKKEQLFKIGDEDFYWEDEFVTSYLSLRDYYFGSHPWDHNNKFHGVPGNIDPETQAKIKEWQDGHFIIYCCTLEEMENVANKVFDEWKQQTKHEDIMDFSVDFARRLGYGKEDNEYMKDPDEVEVLEDKLYIYNQFIALVNSVKTLVETFENSYWFDNNNIRIIIWTD